MWRGLLSFYAGVLGLGFGGEWVTSNTSEKWKPVIKHFDSPVWRLILPYENSQFTIFTTKYGGDPLDEEP